jgi:hypothetical protein
MNKDRKKKTGGLELPDPEQAGWRMPNSDKYIRELLSYQRVESNT